MDFSLKKCSDAEWSAFIVDSSHSVFSSDVFLSEWDDKCNKFLVMLDGQPILGASVFNPALLSNDLVFYREILFSAGHRKQKPQYKIISEELKALQYFLAEMEKEFASLKFRLQHPFSDLRPFLWFHYGESVEEMFSLDVKYTSIINLSERLPAVRESNIKVNVFSNEVGPVSRNLQNLISNSYNFRLIESAIKNNWGDLFSFEGTDSKPAFGFFMRDNRNAYLGALEAENLKDSTLILSSAIDYYKAKKLNNIDLCGKGQFKEKIDFEIGISNQLPYYELSWKC